MPSPSLGTINFDINVDRFASTITDYFRNSSWIAELFQNCCRAGSTSISVIVNDDFTISDDGCGIGTNFAAWAKLISVSDTGWDDSVQREQRPAGVGLLACLLQFPSMIQSSGFIVETTPDALKSRSAINIIADPSGPAKGTTITLKGAGKAVSDLESRYMRDLPSLIGGFLYVKGSGKDLTPLNLSWSSAQHNYSGPAIHSPFANQNFVWNGNDGATPSVSYKHIGLHPFGQDLCHSKKTAPSFRSEGPGYSLWFRSDDSYRHRRSSLSYHGNTLDLNEAGLVESPSGNILCLLIHGDTGYDLRLKLPDRCELINNDGLNDFLQKEIMPQINKFKEYITSLESKSGAAPFAVMPDCGDLGVLPDHDGSELYAWPTSKSQVEHLSALGFTAKDESNGLIIPSSREYNDAILAKPLDFITTPLSLCDRDQIQAIGNQPAFVGHNFGLCDNIDDINGYDHVNALDTRALLRLLNHLAHEGKIRCGIMPCDESSGFAPTPPMQPCTPEFVFGEKLLAHHKLTSGQGDHQILITDIGLSVADKSWWSETPFICIVSNGENSTCDLWGRTFIANPAWDALRLSDPKKAFSLFSEASKYSFFHISADDRDGVAYDIGAWVEEANHCFAIARSFFDPISPEDIVFPHLKKNLFKAVPEVRTFEGGTWHWKRFTWCNKTKSFDLSLTIECSDKVAHVTFSGKQWKCVIKERIRSKKKAA